MKILHIIVSRPCAALRSNGSHGHHYAVNAARQDAKREAMVLARMAQTQPAVSIPTGAILFVEYTELLAKNQRAMDDDNLIGAMKSYRDGVAMALGIDDKRMRIRPCGPFERGTTSGVAVRVWIDEAAL